VNEHPVFVPAGEERIAAVITLPDGVPSQLVLLLAGLGVRSHGDRVWTRAARSFAAAGIASIRMDYLGIGDSTGQTHDGPSPVDQAEAVLRTAMDVTGIERIGVVGHCRGVTTALALTGRLDGRTRLICIVPGPYEVPAGDRAGRDTPPRRARSALRRGAARARAAVRGTTDVKRWRMVRSVPEGLSDTDVLFLMLSGGEHIDALQRQAAALTRERRTDRATFAARALDLRGIAGFRVPAAAQPQLIDACIGWFAAGSP
jgi:pimeloyl-ACP methyl ester carboxylesterase